MHSHSHKGSNCWHSSLVWQLWWRRQSISLSSRLPKFRYPLLLSSYTLDPKGMKTICLHQHELRALKHDISTNCFCTFQFFSSISDSPNTLFLILCKSQIIYMKCILCMLNYNCLVINITCVRLPLFYILLIFNITIC